jgi:hypothetical protein
MVNCLYIQHLPLPRSAETPSRSPSGPILFVFAEERGRGYSYSLAETMTNDCSDAKKNCYTLRQIVVFLDDCTIQRLISFLQVLVMPRSVIVVFAKMFIKSKL